MATERNTKSMTRQLALLKTLKKLLVTLVSRSASRNSGSKNELPPTKQEPEDDYEVVKISPSGEVFMLYSEKQNTPEMVKDIGNTGCIKRYSEVEWDDSINKWSVFIIPENKVIYSHESRANCLEEEHKHWQENFAQEGYCKTD